MQKNHTILICLLLITGVFSMLTNNSCKKDDNGNSPADTTVKDIDGNVYHTVSFGSQVWMLENLETTRYRNGDSIANVKDPLKWNSLTTGAQCNFGNITSNGTKYGRLYNFYAVADSRNIAPTGWHVATDDEWTVLNTYVSAHLGTSGSIAKAIAAKTGWSSSTTVNAVGNDLTKNNSSGFTALPGGFRWDYGTFAHMYDVSYWWTATGIGTTGSAFYRLLYSDAIDVLRASDINRLGFSVRCVKDYKP